MSLGASQSILEHPGASENSWSILEQAKSEQANKRRSEQANKQADKRTSKQANEQISEHANMKQNRVWRYTLHLFHSFVIQEQNQKTAQKGGPNVTLYAQSVTAAPQDFRPLEVRRFMTGSWLELRRFNARRWQKLATLALKLQKSEQKTSKYRQNGSQNEFQFN